MKLSLLRALGFDQSRGYVRQPGAYDVKCSQCQALVINGTPTHERGCPNAVHECRGCNELIPINRKYCDACS